MTNSNERAVKVGDVVAWADVPDGALVRTRRGDHASRNGDCGTWNNVGASWWPTVGSGWQWALNGGHTTPVTIVALGLTGRESADDLRRLAEVFDVREAMLITLPWSTRLEPSRLSADPCGDLAERLHAAGWRPGMTAEDAARRLARPQD